MRKKPAEEERRSGRRWRGAALCVAQSKRSAEVGPGHVPGETRVLGRAPPVRAQVPVSFNLWGSQARQTEEGGAGGLRQPRADRCPPPPRTLPPGACQAARCQADSECPRHRRCCYNGCAYACLEAVPPPPVLDWLVQPKPRWLGGNGWLLDGPEEVLQAEACSTTEDGAEPLLCPSGYECHILSPGDVAEGIPNRGQCVKQRRPADGRFLRHKSYKEYPEGDSKNVAEAGGRLLRRFQ
nr:WAP four-disulfide core domain protein 1 isoform X1 [Oryctolagus cuniculus]